MSILNKLLRRPVEWDPRPLYAAVVARGRQPHWYLDGAVADSIDGRFDMISAVLAFTLIRLEALGANDETARMAEIFVDDMDGQLREIGIGDVVVGKHIGKMMSALGGRIGAYRVAVDGQETLETALRRNLYRGELVEDAAVAHVAASLRDLHAGLEAATLDTLRAGRLPD